MVIYTKIIQIMKSLLCMAGASIRACRGTGCHIVALEEDKDIFKAILLPMKKITPIEETVEVNEMPPVVPESQDPHVRIVKPRKFIQKDRPSK